MTKLRQVVLAEPFDHLELVVDALFPDGFDAGTPGIRQPRSDRSPVGRIGNALDEAVTLQVVDESRDVARGVLEVHGEITQRGVAAAIQQKQGAESLDGAHVDVQILEELTHPDAVEASRLVAGQLMAGSKLAGKRGRCGSVHGVLVHSEGLHYHPIQGFGASYSRSRMFAALGEEAEFCRWVGLLGGEATLAAPTRRGGWAGA